MINIVEKNKCCGCSACVSICPTECITMVSDEEGFLYPRVDTKRCLDCGKCEKVCPFNCYDVPENEITDECYTVRYAGYNAREVLSKCASGGAYTAFCEYIVRKGGLAVGAGFDEKMDVRHSFISDDQPLVGHSSSKYVQSVMGDTYKKVKAAVESGKTILFSGTPCQVAGLKKYLGREYDTLYCVDIICAGVASPKIFREYRNILENKYSSPITCMNFKHKTFGYHSSTMTVEFLNGKKYSKSRLTDLMMKCFTAHICDRPSCGQCVVKGENRLSDISLFDCWHYGTLTGKKDDDKGYTSVLVHSKKGKELLYSCKELLKIEQVNAQDAIMLDGNMVKGVQIHHNRRNEFYKAFNQQGLQEAVKQFLSISFSDHLKEASKRIMHRLGILRMVKRIFHKGV